MKKGSKAFKRPVALRWCLGTVRVRHVSCPNEVFAKLFFEPDSTNYICLAAKVVELRNVESGKGVALMNCNLDSFDLQEASNLRSTN